MGRPLTTHQPVHQWVEGIMQYIFRVSSDIPELGASAGDLVVLRPLDSGGPVTVMCHRGKDAVGSLLHNLHRLEPLGPSPGGPVLVRDSSGDLRPAGTPPWLREGGGHE